MRPTSQQTDRLRTLGTGRIDDDGFLAAIQVQKQTGTFRVWFAVRERSKGATVVAAKWLKLDDLGALVGHKLGCVRSRNISGEFQHAYIFK